MAESLAHAAQSLTYSDYVVDRLRNDIVMGSFPPGARLPMKDLCARYEVGNSPLREALHRLTGEGFVQFVGQRGFRVPPLSMEDLADLTRVRSMVEEALAREAISKGDDEWESRIVAAFHKLERVLGRFGRGDEQSIFEYDSVHRHFHVAMYAGVGSPRLTGLHANLFDQAYRYRKLLHTGPFTPEEVLEEHRHLMGLLLERDAEGAVAMLLAHLQLTRASTQTFIDQQGAKTPAFPGH